MKNSIVKILLVLCIMSCGDSEKEPQNEMSTKNTNKADAINNFGIFWDKFVLIIRNKDINALKEISLAKTELRNKSVDFDFFSKQHTQLFDEELSKFLSDKERVEFIDNEIENDSLLISQLGRLPTYKTKEVNITKVNKSPGQKIIILKFVETTSGFKFYGYNAVGE